MSPVPTQFEVAPGRFYVPFCFPVHVMTDMTAADVVTAFTPGFPGRLVRWFWVQGTVVTTGGKGVTLNMEIGTVDVETRPGTNSTIVLTSALCTPVGAVIVGTLPSIGNSFDRDDTISIEASSVTAFSEGAGLIVVIVEGKIMG